MLTAENITKPKVNEEVKWNIKTPPKSTFTVSDDKYNNRIITAFKKGVSAGKQKALTELKEKMEAEFKAKVSKAKGIAEDFYSFINDKKNLNKAFAL